MFKKLFKWIGIIFIGLIVIGVIASMGDDSSTTEKTSGEPEQAEKKETKKDEVKTVGIGETATVADVGFTVQEVQETKEIDSGNEFLENATTDGKFIIADVKIDNGKKEALTIDSTFFKIKTDDGTEYEPVTDGEVMMAMSTEDDFFLKQINPGLSKSGKVVFEVPAQVDLTKAVLHAQTGFFGTESIEIKLGK